MSNYQGGVKNRRKRALQRLENQRRNISLSTVRPTGTVSVTIDEQPKVAEEESLSPGMRKIKRIEKEIAILKTRI